MKKGTRQFQLAGKAMVILFSLWTCSTVLASLEDNLFQLANGKYREGKFLEAVELYERFLAFHPVFEAFYNLGNAAFKSEQIGKAILNYERALKVRPRDRDALSNLTFINRFVEYEVEDKRNWHLRSLAMAMSRLTTEECFIISLVGYFLFALKMLASLVRKRRLVFGTFGITFLGITLLALAVSIAKHTNLGVGHEAVVVKDQVEVRYGPAEGDRLAFRLPEGLKVYVKNERSGWVRIELLNGQSGWAMKSQVVRI